MMRPFSAGGGACGAADAGSASTATCRLAASSRQTAHSSRCALEAGGLVLGQRAQQPGAERVGPLVVIACGRAHVDGISSMRSWLRSFSSPSRIRPFTVPTGASRMLGDLGVGEAAEVGELDHVRLVGGQRVHGRADAGGLLAARDLVVGALAGLEALLEPLVAGAALVVHRGAAELVDRAVVDDPEHPRADRAAGALVAGAGAPDRQEGLLHDVLGDVAAADHPVGEREGGAGVALIDEPRTRAGRRAGPAA